MLTITGLRAARIGIRCGRVKGVPPAQTTRLQLEYGYLTIWKTLPLEPVL
jgi:hypothetical protein